MALWVRDNRDEGKTNFSNKASCQIKEGREKISQKGRKLRKAACPSLQLVLPPPSACMWLKAVLSSIRAQDIVFAFIVND